MGFTSPYSGWSRLRHPTALLVCPLPGLESQRAGSFPVLHGAEPGVKVEVSLFCILRGKQHIGKGHHLPRSPQRLVVNPIPGLCSLNNSGLGFNVSFA